MYKILKKRVRMNAIMGLFAFILVILLMSFLFKVNIRTAFTSFGFAQTITADKKLSDYEGKYVKHIVKYPLEIYAESYGNNSTKPQSISYIVWDEERNDYIGIEVEADKEDKMKTMIDQSWAHLVNEEETDVQDSLKVKGVLKKMNDEQLNAYKNTMNYIFGDQASDQIIDGWYIDDSLYGQSQQHRSFAFSIIVLLCLLIEVFAVIVSMGSIYCIPLKKFIKEHDSATEDELEKNFMTAAQYGNSLWVGDKYSVFINSLGLVDVLLNEDLIWAYYESGKGNTPVCSMHLYTREKKHYKISINETDGRRVMNYITQKLPFVMTGYNKELKKLYKKDFHKFLYKSGLR